MIRASSSIVQSSHHATSANVVFALDARIKILVTLFLIALAFFLNSWTTLGIYCAMIMGLYLLARIPARVALRTAAPLLLIAVFTFFADLFFMTGGEVYFSWGILIISENGLNMGAFYSVRLAALVFCACLLMLTTPAPRITRATEQLLAPCVKFGMPVHEIALMAGIALRFFPLLASEFQTIKEAQESRCAQLYHRGSLRVRLQGIARLIKPLFNRVFQMSETLAVAMDSRCYHGK